MWFSTHLRAYTKAAEVEVDGARTVAELLDELESRFRGLKFRIVDEQDHIRQHIVIFVKQEQVRALAHELRDGDDVRIMGALSGG